MKIINTFDASCKSLQEIIMEVLVEHYLEIGLSEDENR